MYPFQIVLNITRQEWKISIVWGVHELYAFAYWPARVSLHREATLIMGGPFQAGIINHARIADIRDRIAREQANDEAA